MGLNSLLNWRRVLLTLFLVACGARVDAQTLDPVKVEEFFDRAWADTLRDGGARSCRIAPGSIRVSGATRAGAGTTSPSHATPINAASFRGEPRIARMATTTWASTFWVISPGR